MVTWEEIKTQYEERANNARQAGFTIKINHLYETCSIEHEDYNPDFSYYFDDHEFRDLMNRIPQELTDLGLSEEDYLLASSMDW